MDQVYRVPWQCGWQGTGMYVGGGGGELIFYDNLGNRIQAEKKLY